MLSSFCHSHTTIDIVYLAESHFSLQLAQLSNTGTLGVVFTPSTFLDVLLKMVWLQYRGHCLEETQSRETENFSRTYDLSKSQAKKRQTLYFVCQENEFIQVIICLIENRD